MNEKPATLPSPTPAKHNASGPAHEVETWRGCEVCGELHECEQALWKSGDLVSGRMPAAESRLDVVGSPFVKASTDTGNACLRRCPRCGTYYWWEFSYEYLVNGSEDEIRLTRLSLEAGSQQEELLFATIRARTEEFHAAAPAQAEIIRTRTQSPEAHAAAAFFLHGSDRGFDLAPCLSALIAALGDHDHFPARSCPARPVLAAISGWATTPERIQTLRSTLRNARVLDRPGLTPEIEELLNWLQTGPDTGEGT